MLALWLENLQLDLREVPKPAKSGEALIRIRKAGICSTDLELVKGYYPFMGILGHEFVGEVVECDDAAWLGQRVVGDINVSCGSCEQCQSGRSTHCENRTVLGITKRDGTFAEFTTLPLSNLHCVPASVPDAMAVFTEPLAAALEIQQQVHIRPTERVLVIGAGRLGQLIAQTLALTGCDLHVVARHAYQQKILTELGIKLITEEDIQPWRWDVVVEATGSPSGFSLARQAIRPRGSLVLKSTYQGEMSVNFSSIVVDEVNLIGSRCGPFEPALQLIEKGEVDPRPLIAAEFKLEQALQAFEHAAQPGMLKVLIEP
jgi:threonine dehydrogenase-like Zn-dependent dehydrogenase